MLLIAASVNYFDVDIAAIAREPFSINMKAMNCWDTPGTCSDAAHVPGLGQVSGTFGSSWTSNGKCEQTYIWVQEVWFKLAEALTSLMQFESCNPKLEPLNLKKKKKKLPSEAALFEDIIRIMKKKSYGFEKHIWFSNITLCSLLFCDLGNFYWFILPCKNEIYIKRKCIWSVYWELISLSPRFTGIVLDFHILSQAPEMSWAFS